MTDGYPRMQKLERSSDGSVTHLTLSLATAAVTVSPEAMERTGRGRLRRVVVKVGGQEFAPTAVGLNDDGALVISLDEDDRG